MSRAAGRTLALILLCAAFVSCASCSLRQKPRDAWDACADFCAARHERIIGVILGEQRQLVACGCREDKPTEAL
jgi:hypothetical protein